MRFSISRRVRVVPVIAVESGVDPCLYVPAAVHEPSADHGPLRSGAVCAVVAERRLLGSRHLSDLLQGEEVHGWGGHCFPFKRGRREGAPNSNVSASVGCLGAVLADVFAVEHDTA
ncbi:Uncharacterised protein [Streptococcus pneumoniae]|nr:Uncharacterised protein [Streptococcus pneumoniae]